MDLKYHFIVSSILTIILFPFFHWWALLAMVGGFLIDADHYLWWIIVKRNFSVKKAHHHFRKVYKGNKGVTLIFHCVEFWIFKLVVAFFFPILIPLVAGLYVHVGMDLYYYFKHRKTHPNPVAYSLIHKHIIKRFFMKTKEAVKKKK